jgi:hypothetical protein
LAGVGGVTSKKGTHFGAAGWTFCLLAGNKFRARCRQSGTRLGAGSDCFLKMEPAGRRERRTYPRCPTTRPQPRRLNSANSATLPASRHLNSPSAFPDRPGGYPLITKPCVPQKCGYSPADASSPFCCTGPLSTYCSPVDSAVCAVPYNISRARRVRAGRIGRIGPCLGRQSVVRIVLLAADDRSTRSIAKEVGVQPRTSPAWAQDAARPLRPAGSGAHGHPPPPGAPRPAESQSRQRRATRSADSRRTQADYPWLQLSRGGPGGGHELAHAKGPQEGALKRHAASALPTRLQRACAGRAVLLRATDDLGSDRGCPFLQPFPRNLIIDEAPSIFSSPRSNGLRCRLTLTINASRDPNDVVRTATHAVGADPNLIHVESDLA